MTTPPELRKEEPSPNLSKWESINRGIDVHYPRVLRVVGLASAVVGVSMSVAGMPAGATVVGLAGSLITAGIASEALKKKP